MDFAGGAVVMVRPLGADLLAFNAPDVSELFCAAALCERI